MGRIRDIVWRDLYAACAVAWLCLGLVLAESAAFAEAAETLVQQGNQAYAAGRWQEALDAYKRAELELPESPYLKYNRALALWRLGEAEEAKKLFAEAAAQSRDLKLEADCKYNLGNLAFGEGARQRETDPRQAVAEYEKSIALFREALRLKPEFPEAAQNIEVARLTLKALLDELQKRQEQQQQQQQAAEELRKILEEQEQALGKNRGLQQEKKSPEQKAAAADQLASQQQALQEKTKALADAMEKAAEQLGDQEKDKAAAAARKTQEAAGEQGQAAEKLDKNDLANAEKNQEKAVEKLREALDGMKQDQAGGQSQEQQQQQGQEGNQEQQAAAQQEAEPAGEGEKQEQAGKAGDEKQDAAQQAVVSENPRDILNEEKENRARRRPQERNQGRPVDRDW